MFQKLYIRQVLGLAGAGNSKKHQETIADLLYAFMTVSKKFKKYNKIGSTTICVGKGSNLQEKRVLHF